MRLVLYSTLLSILIIGCYGAAHPRSRRNVGQFGVMMGCLLDIPVSRAGADYIGYGCFCGFGSDGSPVDDTDRCCQVHDECYTAVQYSDMCRGYNQAYLIMYNYETTDCGTDDAKLACSDASSYDPLYRYTDCAIAMCACDKAGAECFKEKRPTYNADLIRYPQEKCV